MGAKHIGFIMDGNGRWATAHGLSRAEGYAYGLIALRKREEFKPFPFTHFPRRISSVRLGR